MDRRLKNIYKNKIIFPLIIFFIISGEIFSQSPIDSQLINWDTTKYKFTFNENVSRLEKIFLSIKKDNDNNLFASYYRRLGTLFKDNGDFDNALKNYLVALEYNKKTGDKTAIGSNTNQIGVIYYNLKNYPKTLEYFLHAYNLYVEDEFLHGISSAAPNVSEIYTLLDSLPQAIDFAYKGLAAVKKMEDTSDIGYNYYSIALLFAKQNNTDSALKYYNLALHCFYPKHDVKGMVPTYNSIGELYLKKSIDSSLRYHTLALETATKYQNRPLIAETYGYLSKANEMKGDSSKAFYYLKIQKDLENKILDSVKVQAIVYAERKYDSDGKTREITEQAQQIKIQYLWLVIIIVLSIAIVIIATLMSWRSRYKRRLAQNELQLHRSRIDDLLQKQEVENVNAQLKGQDDERKRIAQELHDRIGSILSTVKLHFSNVEEGIALLKEQQNKSYLEATNLLDEAVDEVRRISHDLYEGSLARFGFKTALLQLIAAVEKANIIKITFVDNDIDMQVYKTIEQDLYRITQELLSNTLKYAEAKEITIQLALKEKTFVYMYEDNGKGFDANLINAKDGIGYKNISTRVAKMKGEWHLDSTPGHGMTLTIEIPG